MKVNTNYNMANFPMGPHMRHWLKISDSQYNGHTNLSPTSGDIANFTEQFIEKLSDTSIVDQEQLVNVLEELVGMSLPLLAIKLVDAFPHLFPMGDFRAQLHVGNASMLINDLARAEIAFSAAQKLVPEEPAPYVNLTQIYYHDGMLEHAKDWCLAGIEVEPNHLRLWELLLWIEEDLANKIGEDRERAIQVILTHAQRYNSWAGVSLYHDLTAPDDVLKKLESLDKFWNNGLKTPEFVTEFTAVLGMAGKYDRVPAIVWQFEKSMESQKDKPQAPWQIYMHLVQAYMGLGRDQDARDSLKKLNNYKDLPNAASQAIAQVTSELMDLGQLN